MSESTVVAPPSSLVKIAKELVLASNRVEELTETLKSAKAQEADIENKLVDQMVTEQVKAFKADGLGGFRTQAVVYPNVVDREALNAYVQKNKKTLGFLYSVSVNGTKLRSFVKELIEQKKKIPPGIEPYTTTEIRRF